MTVKKLAATSLRRAKRWHDPLGLEDWTVLEWAGAMAGEAGEACNWAKKLKRLEGNIRSRNQRGRNTHKAERLRSNICKEAADTILYGFLLIQRCGGDVEEVLREVFNHKSEEYGFPERI